MVDDRLTEKFQELVDRSRRVVFLTGAGISTESGIPDFRSSSGIYADPANRGIFEIDSFLRDPSHFWRFCAGFLPLLEKARPNAAHLAIARLQDTREVTVVTQNIDDLHLKAGSRTVFRVHGSFESSRCLECGRRVKTAELFPAVASGETPKDACGGFFKPEVTFFGETLPPGEWEGSCRAAGKADLLCVVGSSLVVYPAAVLPRLRRAGCRLVIVNREPTPLDQAADLVINAGAGEVFERLEF